MTDKLIEKAKFVRQLFRECDAIQLPHKPTEEALTGLIDHIEADEQVIKAAEALADASQRLVDLQENTSPFGGEIMQDRIERTHRKFIEALDGFNRAMQGRKGGE